MKWQDAYLTFGAIIFIFALVPSLRSSDKPSPATSLTTAGVLVSYSMVYLSLHLFFAAVTTAITAAEWGVLLFQAKSAKVPNPTNKE